MSSPQLKLLVDVGVGTAVEDWLRENDFDTKSVRQIEPSMGDLEIVRLAHAEDRLVLTMDKDFGELVYHAAVSHAGVLLLRLEAATGEEKRLIVAKIMTAYADRLKGAFAVYQKGRLRIRPCPPGTR